MREPSHSVSCRCHAISPGAIKIRCPTAWSSLRPKGHTPHPSINCIQTSERTFVAFLPTRRRTGWAAAIHGRGGGADGSPQAAGEVGREQSQDRHGPPGRTPSAGRREQPARNGQGVGEGFSHNGSCHRVNSLPGNWLKPCRHFLRPAVGIGYDDRSLARATCTCPIAVCGYQGRWIRWRGTAVRWLD